MNKQHNFRSEFKQCGGNLQYENATFDPETAACFMSNGSCPYALAADYLVLLNKFRSLEAFHGKGKIT